MAANVKICLLLCESKKSALAGWNNILIWFGGGFDSDEIGSKLALTLFVSE